MQTLKYVIGADRRALVKDVQDFKIDFSGVKNWLQARQYEDGMRYVFVDVTNEDGTPFDLTGCNVMFEGLLPDGTHRIMDAKHSVMIDPGNGQFRFDFPKQAFSLAGSYKQAFFRIMRDGSSVTTLEFSLEVLADKVISGIVPSDYETPFEELYAKLSDLIANADGEVKAKLLEWQTQINQLITNLNGDYASIQLLVTGLQSQLDDIAQKIKDGNIVTAKDLTDWQTLMEQDLKDFKSDLDKELNQQISVDSDLISGGYIKPFFEPEIARVKAELKPDLFTMGFMTDNHWETADRDKPYGSYSLNHIKNLLAFSDSADLLMLNGDNVNLDNVDLNVGKHETETLVSVFLDEPTSGEADRFIQLGNHDDGSTRRRFQAKNFLAQDEYLHDDYFKEAYRTSDNQGELRSGDSLYFYKDYPDKKIRFISLNTSDIEEGQLDDSGSQKYDRWGTLAIRQEQLNWFAKVALMNVPADYQIVVTSHCPIDSTDTMISDVSRYWNFDVVTGVLAACRDGKSYAGSSTGGEYPVSISVDYTEQGARTVVGNFAGHFHKEWIHDYQGIKIVEINRSLVDDAKKEDIGTAKEDMFNMIQIDTANRHVYLWGFGGSTDRGFDY